MLIVQCIAYTQPPLKCTYLLILFKAGKSPFQQYTSDITSISMYNMHCTVYTAEICIRFYIHTQLLVLYGVHTVYSKERLQMTQVESVQLNFIIKLFVVK